MPTFTYSKQANIRRLDGELKAAGFTVIGITQHSDGWVLIVDLAPAETKDPTAIVNAHVYKVDLQPDLAHAIATIKADYVTAQNAIAAAGNINQLKSALALLGTFLKRQGRLIEYMAGTMELDNTEYDTGELNLDK